MSTQNIYQVSEGKIKMKVTKRNGREEEVKLEKITKRVDKLSYGLNIGTIKVSQKVIAGIYDGITSTEIDQLLSETAAVLGVEHPDYSKLAARIAVSSLHKSTKGFYQTMKDLYKEGSLSEEFIDLVRKYGKQLERIIDYDRDLEFEYHGYKTLEKSYLLKINGVIVERPQHLFMRVALGICGENLEEVEKLYNHLSLKEYTHATPTLFNTGTKRQQMSSCFLIAMEDDSIEGIFNTAKECALISKNAGGIGLHVHNVRASGTPIKGTNGTSNGIVPMLRVFNSIANYVDQCFDPDTDVYTTSGIKKIKDIVIGDEVITSNGSPERVRKIFRRNNMDERIAYKLKLKHSIKPVTVTGAHPLLILRGQKKMTNYSVISQRLAKNFIKPEFISVEELNEDDLVGFSIPKYEQDLEEYTLEDCRFYGSMLGDGHLSKDGSQSYICGNPKKDDFAFYSNYLYSCGITYTESIRDENYKRLVFSPHLSDNLFKFDRVHLYDENGEKRLHPSMLHLSLDKTKEILKGLLNSDGFIGEDISGTEVCFEITSENLAESLRYMLLRLGVLTSGDVRDRIGEKHETKNGIIENKKISYRLRVPKTDVVCEILGLQNKAEFVQQFRYEDMIFSRVQKIEKLNYHQGLVYDLELNGPNHDYLTHCGIAHNGGGKRKGSFAVYLEPWHADIEHFLELKKNTGKEEFRARDLFYALWTPDLFMKRVEEDGVWTLMCPHQCPGLSDVYGKDFDKLYTQYEKEGKGLKTVKARELWGKVLESQIETGTPYILYKDSCNEKSNQKNIGVIKSSNLCFSKDTVVAIADGSNGKTIKELADWSQGIKKFPVYSAAEGDVLIKGRRGGGKLRLGPWKDEIKWAVAFKTGTKKVVELTMDNGDKIKCTPDHELALAHGGYVEASKSLNKELQSFFTYTPQDRKTPYRHINSISNGRSKQHIKIWEFHNDYNKGHIDHIQNNLEFPDHIDNLQSLKIEDHLNKNSIERKGFLNSYHKIKNKEIYLENKKIQSRGTGNNTYSGIDNFELIEIGKKIYKEYGLITKGVYLDYSEKNNLNLPKSFSKYRFNGDWSLYYSYCMGLKDYKGEFEVGLQDYIKTQDLDEKRINQLKDEFYFTDENDVLCKKGIKVINIEEIGEEDVYDLTVEDNHNFYIITSTQDKKYNNCRGILVHNCTEILEVSTPEETAVCNLASLSLPSFIKEKVNGKNTLYYDYETLHEVVKTATRNLNLVIDKNYYPTEKTHKSNMRHRPIGLGVQGLANVFFKFKIAYDSEEAKQLNKNIFETIYHAALEESCSLAEKYGAYETFSGSPASKGILQYDMWGVTPSDRYDWSALKAKIKAKGLRNSLLVAPMPTASTASIFGNVEAFEAQTSNIYKRQVLAGEYVMVNSDLIRDLEELNLWNDHIRNKIIEENGSVQNIPEIPTEIKEVYKTIWEISQKVVIDMAADRGAYIDQSQSLNLWLAKPNFGNLNSMHFYAWKKGLKTGMYYLRSKPALQAQKVTTKIENEVKEFTKEEALVCSLENPEDCVACGS